MKPKQHANSLQTYGFQARTRANATLRWDDAQVLVYNLVTKIGALPLTVRRELLSQLSPGEAISLGSTYSRPQRVDCFAYPTRL